jgi:hypothetical protein
MKKMDGYGYARLRVNSLQKDYAAKKFWGLTAPIWCFFHKTKPFSFYWNMRGAQPYTKYLPVRELEDGPISLSLVENL